MKKALSFLLAIVLVLSMIPTVTFAANGDPTISFETTFEDTMKVGDTFTVTASLANNPGLAGMVLTLKWNEDAVKFNGFETEYDEDDEDYVLVSDVLGVFPLKLTMLRARSWAAEPRIPPKWEPCLLPILRSLAAVTWDLD